MQIFNAENAQISYVTLGSGTGPVILWAHGWGQNHRAFLPLAESLSGMGQHIVVDFPGFGQSPPPPAVWGSAEYSDFMAKFIREVIGKPVIWVGHSFGCRVGLNMAIRHRDLVAGVCIIGGAGLRRKRTLIENITLYSKIYTFKTLKKMIPLGVSENWLKSKFGSADYRNAGPMRPVMVKVNAEDMTEIVPAIKTPVMLAYGTKDRETPPEIGERLHRLIPGSELLIFDGLDHYTIIGESRHQVAPHLKKFIEKNAHA